MGRKCCCCKIADTDTGRGFVASGSDVLLLEPGDTCTTTKVLKKPGYSLALELGLTLGSATGPSHIRDITGGSAADYAGLRIEVIDDADNVLAYFEFVAPDEYDLDGQSFFADSLAAYTANFSTGEKEPNPFYTKPDPYIQQVYGSAKLEICCTEGSIQLKTWFVPEYLGFIKDSNGVRYSWTSGTPVLFGMAISRPYEHTTDARLRVRNGGSENMGFARILAERKYDSGDSSFPNADGYGYGYGYGCETITNESNTTCTDCQTVCTWLPGNRYHDLELVSQPFSRDLVDPVLTQRNGCGYYTGFDSLYLPPYGKRGYYWEGELIWDFDSDVVVDQYTGEPLSGTMVISNGRLSTDSELPVTEDSFYSISATPIELKECSIVWRFSFALRDTVSDGLETATEAVESDVVRSPLSPMTWSGQSVYTHPDGPPPNLTGTVKRMAWFYGQDRNALLLTKDIEVPIFDTCSPLIRWELVSADADEDAPRYVRFLSSAALSPVEEDGLFYADLASEFEVIDLAGKYLELRIC